MCPLLANAGPRHLFLTALAILGSWAVAAQAADPERMSKVDQPAPAPAARTTPPSQPAEGPAIAFDVRAKPWVQVMEWLSEQTGMPVIFSAMPSGTFHFISPPGRKYTIPEIIDLLNEALIQQSYLLLRRERNFVVVPADEKINAYYLPLVRVEDFERRGNTEVVQVVIPLPGLAAGEVAPEVKKMMGPFGEVVALGKTNQLLLQDTVGNLKRIDGILKDTARQALNPDDARGGGLRVELIGVGNLDAILVAGTLRAMFGTDPKTGAPYIEADGTRNVIVVRGSREQVTEVKAAVQAISDGGIAGGNMRVITLDKGSAATLADALRQTLPQIRQNPVRVISPADGGPGLPGPNRDRP